MREESSRAQRVEPSHCWAVLSTSIIELTAFTTLRSPDPLASLALEEKPAHKDSIGRVHRLGGTLVAPATPTPTGDTMATPRNSTSRPTPKQLRLVPGENIHVGLDVHKLTPRCCPL